MYFRHDRLYCRPVCKHSDERLFNIIQYLIIYNHYNRTIIQVPIILISIYLNTGKFAWIFNITNVYSKHKQVRRLISNKREPIISNIIQSDSPSILIHSFL